MDFASPRSPKKKSDQGTVHESENSRKGCAVSGGLFGGFPRKTPGKSGKTAGKLLPNREALQILGFRAPGKA